MAPKASTSGGAADADIKSEHILAAILLADPYGDEKTWGPLARQESEEDGDQDAKRPWSLTPLLGTPLLGWTLESLASGGVQQVYVFARSGVGELKRYVSSTTFATTDISPLKVTVCPTSAFTPGDVLREVDARALLKSSSSSGGAGSAQSSQGSHEGTFVLARCGYIGSLDLSTACSLFAAQIRRENGSPCLQSVIRPVAPPLMTSQTLHACTPSRRLVHFSTAPRFPRARRAVIPAEVFSAGADGQDLLLRTDLESVGLDICSFEVPALFTENFDYQFIRPDFINGILTSDLLGKTIFALNIGEDDDSRIGKWATHAGTVRGYCFAIEQILARKGYPLVPEGNIPGDHLYALRRNRVYIGEHVELARDCVVGPSTLIGPSTSIASGSCVSHSVLGASASIGTASTVERSIILDGASVASDCRIADSVIDEGVVILEGSSVERGCLVGRGSKIGKGARLSAVRVGPQAPDGVNREDDKGYLGEGGQGEVWTLGAQVGDEDEDEDEEGQEDARNAKLARLGVSILDEDLVSSSSSLSSFSSAASVGTSSSISIAGVAGLDGLDGAPSASFIAGVKQLLDRALGDDEDVETGNALLELRSHRLSCGASHGQLRTVVVATVCEKAGPKPVSAAAAVAKGKGILVGLMEDGDAQVETLLALQRHCADATSETRLFPAFLKAFYDEDIVEEHHVKAWYASPASKAVGGDAGLRLREVGARFLQALASDSEDEASDD